MSIDIRYPRKRKPQFILLGLCVVAFIASFFWAKLLPFAPKVNAFIWFAHLMAIAFGLMGRAVWFKSFVAKDYARVGQFPQIDHEDIALIKSKNLDCTIHELERSSRSAEGHSYVRYDYHVEFDNDDDHVWFLMARPTKPKPPSFHGWRMSLAVPRGSAGMVGPLTRIIPQTA